MSAIESAPGWFGKLPALGDFVTRRLPQSFVRPWDTWITNGVEAVQRDRGDAGREALLTFPIWRFVVPPDVLDANAWFGLLAPSVDRVGRCFPLTVALALAPRDYGAADLGGVARVLDQWTAAVTAVLDNDDVSAFDEALAQAPHLAIERAPAVLDNLDAANAPGATREFTRSFTEELSALGSRALQRALGAQVLWWADPYQELPGLAFSSQRLDDADLFNRLLGLTAAAESPQLFSHDG